MRRLQIYTTIFNALVLAFVLMDHATFYFGPEWMVPPLSLLLVEVGNIAYLLISLALKRHITTQTIFLVLLIFFIPFQASVFHGNVRSGLGFIVGMILLVINALVLLIMVIGYLEGYREKKREAMPVNQLP